MKQLLLIVAAAFVLLGCGRSPQVRYYVMPTLADEASGAGEHTVIVGPVTIPRLLDRPEIVWRVSERRIKRDELHRWATALDAEIQRAVSANLLQLLPGARVVDYPAEDPEGDAFKLGLDIQRLDAAPGELTLRARWILRRGAGKPRGVGTARVTAPLGKKPTPAQVVDAHGVAVQTLSREIAGRIEAEMRRPPPGKPNAPAN